MFWCKCAFCQREASFFQIRTKTNLWPIRSFCRIALYLSLPVHLSQSPCKFVKYIPRYRKILARNCLFHRLQYKIRRQSNGKKSTSFCKKKWLRVQIYNETRTNFCKHLQTALFSLAKKMLCNCSQLGMAIVPT